MSSNIIKHHHKIDRIKRSKHKKHPAKVLWFTGLSGSGKSTLANRVEEELFKLGWHTYLLDGDNIRLGLNSDLAFSLEDRSENIRRVGEISKLFIDAGVLVLCAFVSPLKKDREFVKSILKVDDFVELFVDCPLEVCEQRDVKGLYAKARAGEIKDFTGISSPFEAPENPNLKLQTHLENEDDLVVKIVNYISQNDV